MDRPWRGFRGINIKKSATSFLMNVGTKSRYILSKCLVLLINTGRQGHPFANGTDRLTSTVVYKKFICFCRKPVKVYKDTLKFRFVKTY